MKRYLITLIFFLLAFPLVAHDEQEADESLFLTEQETKIVEKAATIPLSKPTNYSKC